MNRSTPCLVVLAVTLLGVGAAAQGVPPHGRLVGELAGEVSLETAVDTWRKETGFDLRIHWSVNPGTIVSGKGKGRLLGEVLAENGLDVVGHVDHEDGIAITRARAGAAVADVPGARIRVRRRRFRHGVVVGAVLELHADRYSRDTAVRWDVRGVRSGGKDLAFRVCAGRGHDRVFVPGADPGPLEVSLSGSVTVSTVQPVVFEDPKHGDSRSAGEFRVELAWPLISLRSRKKAPKVLMEAMLRAEGVSVRTRAGKEIVADPPSPPAAPHREATSWCGCAVGTCKPRQPRRPKRPASRSVSRVRVPAVPKSAGKVLLKDVGRIEVRLRVASIDDFETTVRVPVAAATARPYELLKSVAPDRLDAVKKEFGEGFRLIETEHLDVVADVGLGYHERVAAILEQFYRDVHPRFFTRQMPRLNCFLVEDGDEYEAFVTAQGLAKHVGDRGFYHGDHARGPSIVARRHDGETKTGIGTLFRQLVHAMNDPDLHAERPWFQEGFAGLFETGRIVDGRWRFGGPNPERAWSSEKVMTEDDFPTLAECFAFSREEFFDGKQAKTNHDTARGFFLYLLRRSEADLTAFVAAMRDRPRSWAAIAEEITGLDGPGLQDAWMQSVKGFGLAAAAVRRGDPEEIASWRGRARDYGELQLRCARAALEAGEDEDFEKDLSASLTARFVASPIEVWELKGSTEKGEQAFDSLVRAVSFQPWEQNLATNAWGLLIQTLEELGRKDAARSALAAFRRLKAREDRR